jgi:hypothetical protein
VDLGMVLDGFDRRCTECRVSRCLCHVVECPGALGPIRTHALNADKDVRGPRFALVGAGSVSGTAPPVEEVFRWTSSGDSRPRLGRRGQAV